MTREEVKKLIPIIQAFADGKTIEFFKQGEWMELNDPDFIWSRNIAHSRQKKSAGMRWLSTLRSDG